MKLRTLTHPTALELSERKRKLGSELHTSLFFSQGENKIIIAPVYELGVGLFCEQEIPTVLPFDSPVEEIGQRAKASLLLYEKAIKDLRNLKESDWPAYKISGARSLKAFKANYIGIWIQTINANIRVEGIPKRSEQIFVGAYIAPACDGSILGALLLQIYQCCQQLNQAGLIGNER
jgi:hypothetical protein